MDRNVVLAIVGAFAAISGAHAAADAVAPAMKAQVTATLAGASGAARGDATVTQSGANLIVEADVRDMAPGTYGIHLHAVGRCDAPDFASAGPHWNPTARQHGAKNPMGAHKGDLPNLVVGGSGTGQVKATIAGASLNGAGGLIDADGAAIVVHAKPDDYATDPSGNSGGRIACGKLAPAIRPF